MISVTGKKWLQQKINKNLVEKVKQDYNLNYGLSQFIVNRNYDISEIHSINNTQKINNIFINDHDFKNALIAKSDIFVMPSIIHKTSVEGFGISYIEAAQHGVPSLGGKDGGASDAISHNQTGLICDGNDLDDIYSSLISMIENKKYLEFGKSAKEYVSKFQWCKILEKYKKVLS